MAEKTSDLHIKISPKLKQQFEAMCEERETSVSTAVRDLMYNSVRNHARQNGKTAKTEE